MMRLLSGHVIYDVGRSPLGCRLRPFKKKEAVRKDRFIPEDLGRIGKIAGPGQALGRGDE